MLSSKRKVAINLLYAVLAILSVMSCASSKDVAYLQDKVFDNPVELEKNAGIVIEPKDMLSIVVNSRTPELAPMFNLPIANVYAGTESFSGSQRISCYTVDEEGFISFPVLGKIKVLGMTRWECADYIKKELIKNKYLDDPIVIIEFTNFKVSVLGEVKSPGTYTINGDRLTILQAISLAGDLPLFGQRKNVSVIRENAGERTIYEVDLTSTSIFQSPAYYIKQNDIIYVEPTDIKKRQSTVDDKALRITSIALSSSSVLVSIATLVSTLVMRNK